MAVIPAVLRPPFPLLPLPPDPVLSAGPLDVVELVWPLEVAGTAVVDTGFVRVTKMVVAGVVAAPEETVGVTTDVKTWVVSDVDSVVVDVDVGCTVVVDEGATEEEVEVVKVERIDDRLELAAGVEVVPAAEAEVDVLVVVVAGEEVDMIATRAKASGWVEGGRVDGDGW